MESTGRNKACVSALNIKIDDELNHAIETIAEKNKTTKAAVARAAMAKALLHNHSNDAFDWLKQ